jgi:hypothetical protein
VDGPWAVSERDLASLRSELTEFDFPSDALGFAAGSIMRAVVITAILVATVCAASAQESFESYQRKAMAQDYNAQRYTAVCLRTARCVGSPVRNLIEACAWRIVILGSGHSEVDASDIANYQHDCQSLIVDQERANALTKAEELFRRIYKRELPSERLLP